MSSFCPLYYQSLLVKLFQVIHLRIIMMKFPALTVIIQNQDLDLEYLDYGQGKC